MGRDWYWGSKSSKRVEKGSPCAAPSGCMCAVFQLFDFQQFQFQPSFKPTDSYIAEERQHSISTGAEAPRNSLELEEPSVLLSPIKEDENLNIPMGIQIKTTSSKEVRGSDGSSSISEISSSPGTKTPNLVARLMGLDLLPDSPLSSLGTPNLHSNKSDLQHHFHPRGLQTRPKHGRLDSDLTETRSLPETPRISLSARRSDADHRLSLQINKENMSLTEELLLSRVRRKVKADQDQENRSPGHYARQIVKQVKESVSRKVGLDITNTVRNREQTSRDHEVVSQFKSKKISKALTNKIAVIEDSSPGRHSTSSCSPRLKFLESKNNKPTTVAPPLSPPTNTNVSQFNVLSHNTKVLSKPKLQEQRYHHNQNQRPIKKCKKVGEERFGPPRRLKKPPRTADIIRNKQEEPFVHSTTVSRANILDKKSKKTPSSSDLLNVNVPTLLPVKKDPTPPATKIPQKQVSNNVEESKRSSQLSSCSSQSYKQEEATRTLGTRDINNKNNGDRSNGATTATITGGETSAAAVAEYHEYITRILRRTGIDKDTPVSFTRWFSPSHPLDPSIFYYLEHFTTTTSSKKCSQLGHQCNRKLLFHLVDEILVEILKPYMNMKPWSSSPISFRHDFGQIKGSHLANILCWKIRGYPSANCCALEDIDAIIDKDLPQMKYQNEEAFGEEGEGIVTEVEKDILDTLVHETALMFYFFFFWLQLGRTPSPSHNPTHTHILPLAGLEPGSQVVREGCMTTKLLPVVGFDVLWYW